MPEVLEGEKQKGEILTLPRKEEDIFSIITFIISSSVFPCKAQVTFKFLLFAF